PSHRASRRDYQEEDEDVAIQEMPASPIVPAISPSNSDYFARSIKTTAAPLPQTSDSITELYPDGSALSTPLTSISSSSFFVDSSASVEHTALSSIYSNSPPTSPSIHPTSRPGPSQINESIGLQLHGIPGTTRDSWPGSMRDIEPHTTFRSTPDLVSGHLVNGPGSPTVRASGEAESTNIIYQFPSQSRSSPSLIRVPRTSNEHTPPALNHQHPFSPFQGMRPHGSSSLNGHGQSPLWPNTPSPAQGTGVHPHSQPWSNIPRNSPPNYRSFSQALHPQGNLNSNLFGFPTGVQFGIHGNFLGTSIARDALLAYAHRLYNNAFSHQPPGLTSVPHQSQPESGLPDAHHQQLLSLLDSIKSQHPRHLPTLLLLSCVQFSIGNYDTCANVCSEILSIDGNYVGMVMKVKGAIKEAESLWMKAIKLRPTYWDAIDNLLHVLCEPATLPDGVVVPPRYHEAIGVLDHVLNILIRSDGLLLVFIPPAHLHRLQNLLYTSGNLRAVIQADSRAALHDHTRGLELMFRAPGSMEVGDPLHFRDIIIATVVIGLLASELPNSPVLKSIANAMNIDSVRFTSNMLDRGVDWLALVHEAGEKLVEMLLNQGKGALPMVMLTPEKVSRIPETLFSVFSRTLPALCVRASYEHPWVPAPGADDPGATKVTSTILLSIAKSLQTKDLPHGGAPFGPGKPLPRSLSLIIIIYYLAISLNPTPSTYNNMGILFYTVKNSASTTNAQGNREVINGFVLAQLYYRKGLSMDPNHPHLLTNYGSLLKDQGRPLEAVRMYKKALEVNPDFDVALANIANLIKDSGNIPEAVGYYQRALTVSPDFPDVICGFVNAMSSICDWRGGRGSTAQQPMVDEQLNLIFREEGDNTPRGWMGKLETVTKKQLLEGYGVGEGIMRTFGGLKEWRAIVQLAFGQDLPDDQRRHWDKVLGRFFGPFNRYEKAVNETGFVIRLIEMLNRITQQKCNGAPTSAICSALPYVLRLVAYRNALKISYDALIAPWLPATVYQPPSPPTERLNIGYVSSDF
ncbi:559_t:CDS:2, partial [Acaulospora colombiana]